MTLEKNCGNDRDKICGNEWRSFDECSRDLSGNLSEVVWNLRPVALPFIPGFRLVKVRSVDTTCIHSSLGRGASWRFALPSSGRKRDPVSLSKA